MIDKIDFLGIKLNPLTKNEIVDAISNLSKADTPKMAFYLNAHCVNIAFSDPEYREILNKADLVYAGGQGVVWAAGFLRTPLPERTNILDFFDILAGELKERKTSIYLLGGTQAVVKRAEEVLIKKGLKISGSRNGFFDKGEEAGVIREINSAKPDILMVGMGVPKQEKWIYNHLAELDVNLCWAVGAAFDWLSGYRKRAPAWMIKCGLEWLHRFLQQPIRLWKRYFIGNLLFCARVCACRLRQEAGRHKT